MKDNILVIKENYTVDNIEMVISHLTRYSDLEEAELVTFVKDFIETNVNTVFHINSRGIGCEGVDGTYAWLDTGVKDFSNKTLFLSMLNKGEGHYEGHFIGTMDYLIDMAANYLKSCGVRTNLCRFKEKYKRKVAERNNENKVVATVEVRDVVVETKCSEISEDTYSPTFPRMDLKEIVDKVKSYLLIDKWETPTGLQRFLTVMSSRIAYYVNNDMTDYFVKNSVGNVIVNTGLLDKFGQPIKVLYRYNVSSMSYVPFCVVDSKMVYEDNRFTREDTNKELRPIAFIGADTEPLSLELNDYDISYQALTHIIIERQSRLPGELQNLPPALIASRIVSELELGLNIQKCSAGYAKPTYSGKTSDISWLLPLRIMRGIDQEPELVMAVSKRNGYWGVRTIIPYNEIVRDLVRCVQLYDDIY